MPFQVMEGQYSTDVISDKADGYIREAVTNQSSSDASQRKPFYLQARASQLSLSATRLRSSGQHAAPCAARFRPHVGRVSLSQPDSLKVLAAPADRSHCAAHSVRLHQCQRKGAKALFWWLRYGLLPTVGALPAQTCTPAGPNAAALPEKRPIAPPKSSPNSAVLDPWHARSASSRSPPTATRGSLPTRCSP
jgi:hypothetical protein